MTDEIKGKDGDDDGKLLYCSFCGKSQDEVRKLMKFRMRSRKRKVIIFLRLLS